MKLTAKESIRVDIGTHVWHFEQGETKEIPDALAERVQALYGGLFGDTPTSPQVEAETFEDAVFAAVKKLFDEGDPDNFTKAGKPKLGAVRALLPEGYRGHVDGEAVTAAVDVYLAQD